MSSRFMPCLAAALALGAWACSDQPLASRPVAGLRVTPLQAVVPVGKTVTLHADALDGWGDPVRGRRILYWSDHPEVATVDSLAGVVTGIAPGTARITVSAPPQGVVVSVTVDEIQGGKLVARLELDPFQGCPFCHLWRDFVLDTWSLSSTYLPFELRNAAGESLCGIVPVTFEVDSTLVEARYAPPTPGACLITLTPRSAGTGWLRARAADWTDSVHLVVRRNDYRWTFGAVPTEMALPVATTVAFEFAVAGRDGSPVSGLPVSFGAGDPLVLQPAKETGANGAAVFHATLPASTFAETTKPFSCGWPPSPPTRPGATFQVWVGSRLPDSTYASTSLNVELRPGEPHHLQPISVTESYYWMDEIAANYSTSSTRYVPVTGDSLLLESYERSGGAGPPRYGWYTSLRHDYVAVFVADQFGNPTYAAATASSADGTALQTQTEGYWERSSEVYDSCREDWVRKAGVGRIAKANLVGEFAPRAVTFSYPGIPSRTIIVSGVRR